MTDEIDEWVDELKVAADAAAKRCGWNGKTFPPGKMEGNPWYVPYMWEQLLEGADFETCGVWECTKLEEYEKICFDLNGSDVIGIRSDDNGFVRYKLMTMDEYDELQAEAQFDREHP